MHEKMAEEIGRFVADLAVYGGTLQIKPSSQHEDWTDINARCGGVDYPLQIRDSDLDFANYGVLDAWAREARERLSIPAGIAD